MEPRVKPVVIRAASVLNASGALDVTPKAIPCNSKNFVSFNFSYIRGGAAGAFAYQVEFSNDGKSWFPVTEQEADMDLVIHLPEYTAVGATLEFFASKMYPVQGQFVRVNPKETGNTGAPGTLTIEATLIVS